MDGLPLAPFAQVIGITSSAFLAGSTATYSFLLVPAITSTSNTPSAILEQWRTAYRIGFYTTPPQVLLAGASWTYLALTTPPDATALRVLYGTAAVLMPSILGYTFTVQRAINGALSRRADRAFGSDQAPSAEKLGFNDEYAKDAGDDERVSTRELVLKWGRYNYVRAALGGIAALCGTWACLNENFLGGIQIGAQLMIRQLLEAQQKQG